MIQQHPDILGIGLDEDTAIIVTGNRFEVLGASKALDDAAAAHPAGEPWWEELSSEIFSTWRSEREWAAC